MADDCVGVTGVGIVSALGTGCPAHWNKALAAETGCRALVRYAPCRQMPCHLTAVLGNDFWWAKLHDLSIGGVGLLLDQPVEVGGFRGVEQRRLPGEGHTTRLPTACRYRTGDVAA